MKRQFPGKRLLLATAALWVTGAALAEQAPPGNDESVAAAVNVDRPVDIGGVIDSNLEMDPAVVAQLNVLNEALVEYQGLGDTGQALQTVGEIVALIEKHNGNSVHLIGPLRAAAQLQLDSGDKSAAELTLGRLIGLIEYQGGVFSNDLVDPLTMLGRIYANSNRREEAITLLRRARHITHRTLGILNLEQLELSDELANIYLRMGDINEGSRENRFAFRVGVRAYGTESAELVPSLHKLAAWYERIGEFTRARQYYKQSMALIEKESGADDLRMVDSLQKMAGTFRKQGIYKNEGRNALIRAIDIHEAHPEADEIAYAYSLTELGDWYMATMRTKDALEIYRRVWNLLTADGASPERADIIFGQPKRLRYEPPLPAASRMTIHSELVVDLEFVVAPDGSVNDISITNATADWRTQNEVKVAMRHARYRPRFVDGQPVPARISTRWSYALPEHLRRPTTAETPEQE